MLITQLLGIWKNNFWSSFSTLLHWFDILSNENALEVGSYICRPPEGDCISHLYHTKLAHIYRQKMCNLQAKDAYFIHQHGLNISYLHQKHILGIPRLSNETQTICDKQFHKSRIINDISRYIILFFTDDGYWFFLFFQKAVQNPSSIP